MNTVLRRRATLPLVVTALAIASLPGRAARADCGSPANTIEA